LVSEGWSEKIGDIPLTYCVHSLVGQNKDGPLSQTKEAPPSQEEPVAPPLPIKKEKPPVPPKKPTRLTQQVCNRVVTIINMNDILMFF
jgi:hypothetical protein